MIRDDPGLAEGRSQRQAGEDVTVVALRARHGLAVYLGERELEEGGRMYLSVREGGAAGEDSSALGAPLGSLSSALRPGGGVGEREDDGGRRPLPHGSERGLGEETADTRETWNMSNTYIPWTHLSVWWASHS